MYICNNLRWQRDQEEFLKILRMVNKLGYQGAIVHFNTKAEYLEFSNSSFSPAQPVQPTFPITIKNIKEFSGKKNKIPLIPCLNIHAEDPNVLKQNLSKYSDLKLLIAVKSMNKSTLEVAARDGRVDILMIDDSGSQKILTKGILSLARQAKCTLLFSLTSIIEQTHFRRTKLLRTLYRLFLLAKPSSISYIHGMSTDDPFLLRGPKEYIGILTALLGVPERYAKMILSKHAEDLILRYIKRYHELLIDSGVEVVNIEKGGKKNG